MTQPHYPWVRSKDEQRGRDYSARWYRHLRRNGLGWFARHVWKVSKKASDDLYAEFMGRA